MNLIPRARCLMAATLFATTAPALAGTVTANFTSASTVPVTAASYTATGNDVALSLGFAPPVGTNLTVVNNTGIPFISGQFSNLAQGQMVTLSHGGNSYSFVANYYGGTGNDLVLQWAYQDLAAWGFNNDGQLGNGSTTNSSVPVLVTQSGVLAGKTVVSVAAGFYHSVALCSDGTVASWGYNAAGQLGNNSTTDSSVPVLVNQNGVLAGKTVVSVAAGDEFSIALCSDGTVAAWGDNTHGELGNGSTTQSNVPVLVTQSGVLAGKTVVSVSARYHHSVALCSDGTVAAWGWGNSGQLGNNGMTDSSVPVLVTQNGVLASKTVVSVAAGYEISIAICSDGTVAAWGWGSSGELGNGGTTYSSVPVLVNQNGVLAGKTVVSVAAGLEHCVALCLDGTVAAWGYGYDGELGNNSTSDSSVPVLVTQNGVLAGKTVVSVATGEFNSQALCSDGTVAAWGWGNSGDLGNNSTTNSSVPVLVTQTGVLAGKTVVSMAAGGVHSLVLASVQNPADLPTTLSGLFLSSGNLSPSFNPATSVYNTVVPYAVTSVTVTPTSAVNSASITVNGNPVTSGLSSQAIPLVVGTNTITIVVTAPDGVTTETYTVTALHPEPINANYTSASMVPISSPGYSATGNTVNLSLGFAPPTGTNLTVVNNTGLGFITGQFSNLFQGQVVNLSYGGNTYRFVANYYGGTGNDLVLQWAYQDLAAWGDNSYGELGNNSTIQSNVPVLVTKSGVLAGKTVVSVAAGSDHCLALCSDGTVAAWGDNSYGELGNNSTTQSNVPVLVTQNGVLAGKTVVSVAAGGYYSLALCSDGTMAAWGYNYYGELGNGSTTNSSVPVLVTRSGVLAGKTVVSVAASGSSHCLALCSDGSLASWGDNTYGQLGNNSKTWSNVPVLVTQNGVLAGKTVVSVAAGGFHSLVLCSDGTIAAWGNNDYGQLGNNSTNQSSVPVLVTQSGMLAGKTVVSVAAGVFHSLALCSDGTAAAWGYNSDGELGNNSQASSTVPVPVTQSGVLAGKSVVSVSGGEYHSLALCSDGTVAAWGQGYWGELGNNSNTYSFVPVLVTQSGTLAGITVSSVAAGDYHNLALVGVPNSPDLSALSLSSGTLSPAFDPATTSYSVSVPYAQSITVTPTSAVNCASIRVNGSPVTSGLASQSIPLVAETTITIVVTAPDGVTAKTYTVTVMRLPGSSVSTLTGLVLSSSSLSPSFSSTTTTYTASVTHPTSSTTVTPTVTDATATVTVNGTPVASGAASGAIPLAVGNNTITTVVTAQDGVSTTTYTISVTRLPASSVSTLSGLVPSGGTLSPSFASATTSYTASVIYLTTSISVRPSVTDPTATVTVNGTTVTSGTNSAAMALAVGTNTITTLVTAQDGVTTTTYTITVTRLPISAVSTLSGLVMSSGALNPSFTSAITSYSASFPYQTTSISVTPTVTDATATVKVNDITVVSGTNSAAIPLAVGTNTITILVTAQDGTTTSTYTITITRLPAFSISTLSGLLPSSGILSPSFASATTSYTTTVTSFTTTVTIRPTVTDPTATVTVNGSTVASGTNSAAIPLAVGTNTITTVVTAQDGITTTTYIITITRSSSIYTYYSANDVPVTATSYTAYGTVNLALGFAPPTGTNLMVVKNTGLGFISGQFSNLSQGQVVNLSYGGKSYRFVVNYYGGTGNDLVLQWGYQNLAAWGDNSLYQLGNYNYYQSNIPISVTQSAVLVGKTVTSVSAGYAHSLALCSDGTVVAWGENWNGQLGNNSTYPGMVPVPVTQSGVLAGKTVVSVSAGTYHSLALCSDGTVAAWGDKSCGELGNNSTGGYSKLPVLVTQSGVLAGKTVVSIAAGYYCSIALCSDGTVAAWGYNNNGQLGNSSTTNSSVPVLVTQSGVLAGKTVVSVAVGGSHNLALCSDGTVATWGDGSSVPSLVTQSGALAGKTVVSVSAGYSHSLVLCSDSTVAAWGYNGYGQLGNNSTTSSSVPVLVAQSGVLAGKTVVSVKAGQYHSLAVCSDGTVAAWGYNNYGQLGNNSITNSSVPVLVTQSGVLAGETVVSVAAGYQHSLALASVPNSPDLSALSLNSGSLSPSFNPATTAYNASVSNVVSTIRVTPTSAVSSASISVNGSSVTSGLASQTIPLVVGGNIISIVVTAPDGVSTKTYTLTVTRAPSAVSTLSNLVFSDGTLSPAFATASTSYTASVPNATNSITVTPTVTDSTATVTVNGTVVASGSASVALPLAVGDNTITTLVTAQDGTTQTTYTTTVTRAANAINSYAAWIATFPGLSDTSPSGNPAHDGIPNLLKYVLNGNPGVASPAILPVVTKVAGNFVFTFSRLAASAQDCTQIFQYSADLSNWTDVMITSPTDAMVSLGAADSYGVQTVTVTIQAGTNPSVFGRLNVSSATAGLSGFSAWILTYPGLTDTTPSGDPDQDGIPNLLEYVLNGNPGLPSSSILPVVSKVAGNFVFSFSRRVASAQDTTQVFQYSTDLSHWTDVMITSPTDTKVTLGVADSNGVQTVTVAIPQGTNTNLFGRLKVTQP